MEATIRFRTFFNTWEGTPERLLKAYHTMMDEAINVKREDRPRFYFDRFILSGITFDEFQELINKEVKE